MHDHLVAFWLILVGGLMTVVGIGLTVKTVNDIRRAVRRFDARIYVGGFATAGGSMPRPPMPRYPLPMPLEDRMLAVERQRISQLPWEWRSEIQQAAEAARGEAAAASEQRAFELSNALRDLISPLTRDWRIAGLSAAPATRRCHFADCRQSRCPLMTAR